jgi:hypothetical protein
MKHSHVLRCDNVDQHASLHVANLDEARFESQNVRIEDGKGVWIAFPSDHPIMSCSPTITIDKDRIVGIA